MPPSRPSFWTVWTGDRPGGGPVLCLTSGRVSHKERQGVVIKNVSADEILTVLKQRRRPYHDGYLAMYSSWLGGIVTDPLLMLHPVDDHLVHRGDGVFETMKCVAGGIYNLHAHLDRLEHSAQAMHLPLPRTREELVELLVETTRAGGESDAVVRLFISRGPGSFGVNPYESIGAQVVVVTTRLGRAFMDLHPEGAVVRSSRVPAKPASYAGIKNCNYHPNVLMAREAVDTGSDFVVSYDEHGRLAESATENVGIVDALGALCFPSLDGILPGTTMLRVCELARTLVNEGALRGVAFCGITRDDVRNAREMLVVGTTRNVIAVREYDGAPVGAGVPGPVWRGLSALLDEDMHGNPRMRTEVFER
jgi:branched-subunit amino acid aminotransferase/4-amino-4-deoxychorismate lyase